MTSLNIRAFAVDCATISDNTWDCGTPAPNDNLTVNHEVTLAGDFNVGGTILINSGGKLTITGNVSASGTDITVYAGGMLIIDGAVNFSSNGTIMIEGDVQFNNTLTLQNSSELIVSGAISVVGNVRIEQGAILDVQAGATFFTNGDFESNSNGVSIDGDVSTEGNFINDKKISGTGKIHYEGSCSGSGKINGLGDGVYCGYNPIDLANLSCILSDITPPEINNIPEDITVFVPANSCEEVVNWTPPTITDNCALQTVTQSHVSGDVFQVGVTIVTYNALDVAGNSNEKSFSITVIDNIDPVIANLPSDITQNVDAGSCGAIVNWTLPTATDNCSATLSSSHNPGDLFIIGTTTVSYTALDLSGNSTIQSFDVTISDNLSPTINNLPSDITQNADAGSCGAIVNWTLPTATDNCSTTLISSHNPGDLFTAGTTTVSYTAQDLSGNSSIQTFDVTISDNIAPAINNLPSDITQNADAGSCGAIVNWTLPTATDNCSTTLISSHNPGDLFTAGTTTVSYTALDINGNSTVQTFDVTISDNVAPTINNLPSDIIQNADAGSCGAIVNWTLPTATDNCVVSLSSTHNSGDLFIIGTTTVSYTALDLSGNSTVQTFDVTISDNLSPTISNLPSDITQNADAGNCGAIVNWAAPTATDNCSVDLSSSHNPGDLFSVGSTTVSYTAVDLSGNSTIQSFDVTISDNIDPVINNLPSDITQNADAGSCGAIVTWTLPTASDNCSVTLSSSHNPGDLFNIGTTTVNYTATDISGNSTVRTFDVTITDNIAPTINNLPSDITQNADVGNCGAIVTWAVPTATDNCSASLSSSHNPGDLFGVGTTTVSYTASDVNGNSIVQTFDVVITDNLPPVINNLPADIIQNADAGICGAIVNWILATATDNCSVALSSSHNPGDLFNIGTTTVNYTATDLSGNITLKSFNIIIIENTPPEINNLPDDITTYLPANSCETVVNWIAPTITDNCAIQTIISSHNPDDIFQIGTTSVTYTAVDKAGNSVEKTFKVTVVDAILPIITNLPADVNQNSDDGFCGAIVSWATPIANDNCSSTLISDHFPGDYFPEGITKVTYTATDLSGNNSTQSFNISIIDGIDPEISDLPDDITTYLPANNCETIVNWTTPTITDNCTLQTVTSSHNPGDIFQVGVTAVTYTATDVAGNSLEKVFNISVADTISPVITNLPQDIIQIGEAGLCGAVVNWTAPSNIDNCSSILSADHSPGDFFPLGTTKVTYSAEDLGGNSSTKSFEITIADVTDPEIINLPDNITAYLQDNRCEATVSWAAPTITDDCALLKISPSHNPNNLFQVGTTPVTYTAVDVAGNSTEKTFIVTVLDTISPIISNFPEDIAQSTDARFCGAIVSWTAPTVSDNCSADLTSDHLSGDFFPLGTTKITYTARDLSGNSSAKSFSVTIEDDIDPEITNIPDKIVVYLPDDNCEIIASWPLPTSADNCAVKETTSSHNPGNLFPVGVTAVSYQATDNSGNTAEKIFNVIVVDTISPTITNIPAEINEISEVGICGATINWTPPTSDDNCAVTLISDYSPGDFFPVGTTKVTYTTSDISFNKTSKSFNVTVVDRTDAETEDFPDDIVAYLPDNSCQIAVTWTPPTITDDCSMHTVTASHKPGDKFQLGSTTVIYKVTNESGNFVEKDFEITVLDTISPTISNMPSGIYQNAEIGSCGAIINWSLPTANDNCSVTLNSGHSPGDFFPVGTTKIYYNASDLTGNSSMKSFNVTVIDENPPVFSFCPSSSTVISVDTVAKKSVITWEMPTVEDACSEVTMSSNHNPGEKFDFGVQTIIYTATDQMGNMSQCSFDIRPGLNLPPEIEDLWISAKEGIPIEIQLEAVDPEGQQISIESVMNKQSNSRITDIDKDNLRFVYTSSRDFYGFDTLKVTITDSGLPTGIATAKIFVEVERSIQIEVSAVLTSNADYINDTWFIKNIDLFPNNSVQIYDRWGGLVYKTAAYDNISIVWDGKNNQGNIGNSEYLLTGTYFYMIDLGEGGKKLTGAIEVIR